VLFDPSIIQLYTTKVSEFLNKGGHLWELERYEDALAVFEIAIAFDQKIKTLIRGKERHLISSSGIKKHALRS
jgi:hypothetical protein